MKKKTKRKPTVKRKPSVRRKVPKRSYGHVVKIEHGNMPMPFYYAGLGQPVEVGLWTLDLEGAKRLNKDAADQAAFRLGQYFPKFRKHLRVVDYAELLKEQS